MNILDKANEFAKELENVPEIVQLREISKKIQEDEANKKMLNDFRRLQFEAYSQQIETGSISNEVKEKLNNIGSVISMNPVVAEYLEAEQRFSIVWDNVLKILNDAIGIDFSFGAEK